MIIVPWVLSLKLYRQKKNPFHFFPYEIIICILKGEFNIAEFLKLLTRENLKVPGTVHVIELGKV